MITSIQRRVRRLELAGSPQLPWHLPATLWTDAQLIAFLTNGRRSTVSDDELEELIRQAPDHVLDIVAGAPA